MSIWSSLHRILTAFITGPERVAHVNIYGPSTRAPESNINFDDMPGTGKVTVEFRETSDCFEVLYYDRDGGTHHLFAAGASEKGINYLIERLQVRYRVVDSMYMTRHTNDNISFEVPSWTRRSFSNLPENVKSDNTKVSVRNWMVQQGVTNQASFKRWALTHHPDKYPQNQNTQAWATDRFQMMQRAVSNEGFRRTRFSRTNRNR